MRFNFDTIESEKLDEIRRIKERRSLIYAIENVKGDGKNPIIAEIKRRSPSLGRIREIDLLKAGRAMERGGACAVSVLTDGHFDGKIDDLKIIKRNLGIPVLRKDFIVDEFQIYESYANGADCILLIASLLRDKTRRFVEKIHELGMEALVEIHSKEDLKFALNSGARLIGINNRNLRTMEIDLRSTETLAREIPSDKIVVSESGINSREDLKRVLNAGADAILIGTSIMRSQDIEKMVKWFVEND